MGGIKEDFFACNAGCWRVFSQCIFKRNWVHAWCCSFGVQLFEFGECVEEFLKLRNKFLQFFLREGKLGVFCYAADELLVDVHR